MQWLLVGHQWNLAQSIFVKLTKCLLHSYGVWPLEIIRFTGQNFSWCATDSSTMTVLYQCPTCLDCAQPHCIGTPSQSWERQVQFDQRQGTLTHTISTQTFVVKRSYHTPVNWRNKEIKSSSLPNLSIYHGYLNRCKREERHALKKPWPLVHRARKHTGSCSLPFAVITKVHVFVDRNTM